MSKVFVSKNVQTEITKKKSNFLLLQPEKLQGLEKIGMIDFRYSITYLVFGGKVVVVAGRLKKKNGGIKRGRLVERPVD